MLIDYSVRIRIKDRKEKILDSSVKLLGKYTVAPFYREVHFSSVAQSCLTLWDPMDCSMAVFPVHRQLPELSQTHVHPVGDAIQPSHPRSSPSPPAPKPSQHQSVFNESTLCSGGQSIGVSASASILPMNIQGCFPLGWTGWISLQSKGLSRVFSNTTVQNILISLFSYLTFY